MCGRRSGQGEDFVAAGRRVRYDMEINVLLPDSYSIFDRPAPLLVQQRIGNVAGIAMNVNETGLRHNSRINLK
jgi:hypothetical protein